MVSRIVRPAWSGKLASICLALWFAVGLLTQQAVAASKPQEVFTEFCSARCGMVDHSGRVVGTRDWCPS